MSSFSNAHLSGDAAPHTTSSCNAFSRSVTNAANAAPVSLSGIRVIALDTVTLHILLPYSYGITMDKAELLVMIGFQSDMTCTVDGSPAKVLRIVRASRTLGLAIQLPEGMRLPKLDEIVEFQEACLSWDGSSGVHTLKFDVPGKKG